MVAAEGGDEGRWDVSRFISWLRQQKDRDDPVGDLARDLIRDPGGHKIRRIPALRKRLSDSRVCQGAVVALDAALKEWRATQG
jgi:hypothetical protein